MPSRIGSIRVLLADGHKMLREAQRLLLERQQDLKVIGEAEEGESAVKLASVLAAEIVIMNGTITGRSIIEPIRRIKQVSPYTQVIALALHPTAALVQEILAAGATACLTKECSSIELIRAIRRGLSGSVYLSPKVGAAMARGLVSSSGRSPDSFRLAPREREVLSHIADGQSTKEIAATLGVSIKTIETLRRRLMSKLDRYSVAELTKYALIEGLTSIESQ